MTIKIKTPKKSAYLAEECGIHLGDGYMRIQKNKYGIHYEYHYSGHANDDSNYILYVKQLMKRLYGLNFSHEKSKGNKFFMSYNVKNLVNFKLGIGMPLSPKINVLIPNWIKKNNKFNSKFLRGIFDTDGSLTFKSQNGNLHTYPNISISLKDKYLIEQLIVILNNLGFKCCACHHKKFDKRTNKHSINWDININGILNLEKFIQVIGFKNRKHITKYLIWKKFGFCPIHTTLKDREDILLGKLNPYKL